MNKSDIREDMKATRAALKKEDVARLSRAAIELLLESVEYKNAESVMLYFPIGNEVDTAYLAEAARKDGKRVIYPKTDKESGTMTPVTAEADTKFERGAFGIYEPQGETYAGKIDLIVVPGVAFDKRGGRLGFGKGCYDRFLEDRSALKVGLCYGIQLTDELPCEDHDVMVDMIVTENEILSTKKK